MIDPLEGGSTLVRFGPFELNRHTGELRKHGVRVRLPEQSCKVLLALLQHPGELVVREDLQQRLWPSGTFVDFDHGLNLAVTRLRQALGDVAEHPRYIETLPRKGYRFVTKVEAVGEHLAPMEVSPNGNLPDPTTNATPRGDSSTDRTSGAMPTHAGAHRRSRTWLVLAGAALLIVAVATTAFFLRRQPERTIRQLLPTRVTSNSSEAPIQTLALSPDGKYLAYSDVNGVHVRSMQTADSRVLTDTKGMWVVWWAADATQFFTAKWTGGQTTYYSISLPGGVPHALGETVPSPGGQYSSRVSGNHAEVRRATDGKVYSLDRKDADGGWRAWSPDDKLLAIVFHQPGVSSPDRIEVLDPGNDRWTTVESYATSSGQAISGAAWLSDHELAYVKYESSTNSNLWVLDLDPSTGLPASAEHRLTQWTDYPIEELSTSADGSRLCFLRSSAQSDIYVGALQARGTRLASPHRLTLEEAYNGPTAWTPDSKAILFESNRYGQLRIYKQDIDKDTAELITSGPGTQQRPRISPDGRWILYLACDDAAGRPKTRLMRIPLAGGTAQEILSGDVNDFNCSHTAGRPCVITEMRDKASIFSLLDPITGRGSKVLETTVEAGSAAISPDGQHIAFVLSGAPRNRIRIVTLHGTAEGQITVSGAEYLFSLEWSADGTGFFSGDIQQETTRLLHIERNGASHVLSTQPTTMFMMLGAPWGTPSPDGRYLATLKGSVSANVWMVENPRPPGTQAVAEATKREPVRRDVREVGTSELNGFWRRWGRNCCLLH